MRPHAPANELRAVPAAFASLVASAERAVAGDVIDAEGEAVPAAEPPMASDLTAWLEMGETLLSSLEAAERSLRTQSQQLAEKSQALLDASDAKLREADALKRHLELLATHITRKREP
jgi:hypothetical protein